jgi:hypothetical protein
MKNNILDRMSSIPSCIYSLGLTILNFIDPKMASSISKNLQTTNFEVIEKKFNQLRTIRVDLSLSLFMIANMVATDQHHRPSPNLLELILQTSFQILVWNIIKILSNFYIYIINIKEFKELENRYEILQEELGLKDSAEILGPSLR